MSAVLLRECPASCMSRAGMLDLSGGGGGDLFAGLNLGGLDAPAEPAQAVWLQAVHGYTLQLLCGGHGHSCAGTLHDREDQMRAGPSAARNAAAIPTCPTITCIPAQPLSATGQLAAS